MALNYIHNIYKDVHTLENIGSVVLNYTLSKKECNSTTTIKEESINVGQVVTLPIKHIDGVYEVIISDGSEQETLPDILFYNNLLLSLINSVERSLCGCKPCNDCEDCNDCEEYLSTVLSCLSFTILNFPNYNNTINIISSTIKCNIDEEVLCFITKKQILGKENVTDLLKQICAIYYLSFYNDQIAGAVDTEESNYINEKFKFQKISKCITKLGINISAITNNSGTFDNTFDFTFN